MHPFLYFFPYHILKIMNCVRETICLNHLTRKLLLNTVTAESYNNDDLKIKHMKIEKNTIMSKHNI